MVFGFHQKCLTLEKKNCAEITRRATDGPTIGLSEANVASKTGKNGSASYVSLHQGCQIFLGTTYQNGKKYTKSPQNIPNGPKIYQ
jgi:hypothetical protein